MFIPRKQQLIQQAAQAIVDATAQTLQGPVPSTTDDAGALPTDLNGLRAWLRTALGQPTIPVGTDWPMSHNRLANRLTALEQLVTGKFADVLPRLDLANAALATLQTSDAAQNAQLAFLTAKENLVESATAAHTQQLAALKAQQQVDEATQALLQARATADEAALSTLQQQVAMAQFTATAAQNSANVAQAKADTDADAVKVAKAAADAALATATAAQNSYTTLAGRFRTKQVATPAVTLSGTMTIAIVWDTPFADTNYNAVAEFEGLSVLGLTAVVTNRTTTGCTVTSKNVLGIALLAGAGTVTVTAIHAAA